MARGLVAEEEDSVPVIHTLDKSHDDLKRETFAYLYGGPRPTTFLGVRPNMVILDEADNWRPDEG